MHAAVRYVANGTQESTGLTIGIEDAKLQGECEKMGRHKGENG